MKMLWGEDYEVYYQRLKSLIEPIIGQVLTYEGAPATACYHAISNGMTQSAEDVWGQSVAYLTPVDSSADTRKSPCFLCSWNRRKALFTVAKEHGCNKIALGHHMDDILETLLMNLTFQGAFSTMPPRLEMRKFQMTVIRPLCLVHEADLTALAALRGYRRPNKNCPYEHASHRSAMKEVFRRLEEMNPEARYSMWGAMGNIQADLLPREMGEDNASLSDM